MSKCLNCGGSIPEWYEPKLCDSCLENNAIVFYETSSDKVMGEAHGVEKDLWSVTSNQLVASSIKVKQSFYTITFDDIQRLLKNSLDTVSTHVVLLTMVRDRSSSLINGILFYGDISKLSQNIKEIIIHRKIKWTSVIDN